MNQQKNFHAPHSLLKSGLCALSLALAGLFAAGCDSGSSGGGTRAAAPATDEAHITGNVQDVHGPIMDGTVEVKDSAGKVITTVTLNGSSNHYSVTVPAGTSYPILLIATPPAGTNFQVVKAVVTSSLADRMDITDVTTLVVDSAVALGGLTEQNIAKASGAAIGLRQRQGVSAAAGGGGAGAGQSGGGVSRGGHGGHDMSGMGGGHDMSKMGGETPAPATAPSGQPPQQQPMQQMQH